MIPTNLGAGGDILGVIPLSPGSVQGGRLNMGGPVSYKVIGNAFSQIPGLPLYLVQIQKLVFGIAVFTGRAVA